MRVTEKEYHELQQLYHSMMLFAGKKQGIVEKQVTLKEFIAGRVNKFESRQAIYTIPNFHDNYLKENPDDFEEDELEVIKEFKGFLKGKFYIIKHLKDYSVFLKDDVAYGVLAQNDFFQNMVGESVVMVEAILLPYRGKIVYDGMLQGYPFSFGAGIRSSLNDDYNEAKAKYGIVTSLPFDKKPIYAKLDKTDQLLFFMKDKNNRAFYQSEIANLLVKHTDLIPLYQQECGKIDSTKLKKNYKNLGLNKAHFAVLQGVMIASAIKKEDLDKQIKSLVPKEKWNWVYVFKM